MKSTWPIYFERLEQLSDHPPSPLESSPNESSLPQSGRPLLAAISAAAFLRGAAVTVGGIRSFLGRRRFEHTRMGWAERVIIPEPFLMVGFSVAVFVDPPRQSLAAATAGVLLAAAGLLVIGWTMRSWPSLHVGHGVLPDQKLVTTGAYGWVRHPVYLGGLLLGGALAAGSGSLATAALTLFYVVPAYGFYARSEEAMMAEQFGDTYRRYAARVPGFVPRMRRRGAGSDG